jgi:putative spermidine/putrescine transport system ATP-binding protein
MPPLSTPIVRFVGVQKKFDRSVSVVRDLTLDIEAGEFLTLLGPSGSGKTTTLMMLAGFEQPDAGEILLDGHSVARLPPHKRGIGVVFQNFALFPHMTVAENLAFPLKVRRVDRSVRDGRIARALDMVRMTNMGGRMPTQLSGGQQQRVALARALVFEPRLVLMDEPLGALDKQLREEMQFEIRQLHERLGVTMVYVTHDQDEAMTMSDRIAVFAGGVIQQLGSPRTVYEAPANAFVACFVGENNRLIGSVLSVEDDMAQVRLACGPVVEAQVADGAEPGSLCAVMIRPERIAIAAIPADEMGEGALPGRVLEALYLGDHLRIRLRVGHDEPAAGELVVKRPAGATTSGLAAGQSVSVAWQPHHALVFKMEGTR